MNPSPSNRISIRAATLAVPAAVALSVIALYFVVLQREDVESMLKTSEKFTLYSLSPATGGKPGYDKFHRFPVLGKIEIADAPLKLKLVGALYRSIAENRLGFDSACHQPRHGIRAVKGGRTVDMTICFECANIDIFDNGKRSHVPMTQSAQKLFNDVLRKNRVPTERSKETA